MKIKIVLLAAFSFVLTIANFAQQAAPTHARMPELYSEKTVKVMRQIRRTAVESDYAYRQVGYLANNIGARLSCSPQAQRAVEYVAGEMKKLRVASAWISLHGQARKSAEVRADFKTLERAGRVPFRH